MMKPMLFATLTAAALLVSAPPVATAAADVDERSSAAPPPRRTPVVDVFEANRDAVVNISTTEIVTVRTTSGLDRLFEEFFDMPHRPRSRQYERESVGSGFVIHASGYIVTNAHVVAGTTERRVTFANGEEYEAEIVAIDHGSDLAVLRIDADRPLPAVRLGRSNDLMPGETVICIGNPLGYQHTVTAGIVSATGRHLELRRDRVLDDLIQTDASINPGNSGGPLLNVRGELIGIATAIRGDAQNIGFAISVDQLRAVLPDLLDVERRYHLDVGLQLDVLDGPSVVAVRDGSAAHDAGVRLGDRITAIDGEPVNDSVDYYIALIGRQPGDTLRLRLQRGERTFTAAVVIDERPAPDGRALAQSVLGVEVQPLPDDLAARLNLRGGGLVIARVEPDGPAARTGLRAGDVLLGLGRHAVSTTDELGQLLEPLRPGQQLTITVLRVDRMGKLQLTGTITARQG